MIFSISGARGIVGKSLLPENVIKLSQAFATLCGAGTIVIGRDSRTSSEMLYYAVCAGLISCGSKVVNLEIVPTPTVMLMVEQLNAVGGIAITASHNPIQWNGLKFINSEGMFLNEQQHKKLRQLYEEKIFSFVHWDELTPCSTNYDAVDSHIAKILNLKYLDLNKINNRRLRVAVDCCNGAASVIFPLLLEKLGCAVIRLNCNYNQLFPRDPEPVPEHISELARLVKQHNCDVGFATDADGDRLSIVSEQGEPIGEEYSLVLTTQFVLQKNKGIVVTNQSTTRALEDIVNRSNCKLIRTKVGEIYVASRMKESKSIIGGEGNGGVIIPEVHYTRDAMAAAAIVLQYLAESNTQVSTLVQSVPKYFIHKKALKLDPTVHVDSIVSGLIDYFKGNSIDLLDGLKVNYTDSWIHVRASQTEPIIRIIAEATTKEKSIELVNSIEEKIMNNIANKK